MFTIKRFLYYMMAIFMSGLANLSIRIIPFKHLINRLAIADHEPVIGMTPDERKRLEYLTELVEYTADHVPWRSKCFENALVFCWFCKVFRIRINLSFGIRRQETGHNGAHAWTWIDDVVFTGDDEVDTYTTVYHRVL